MYPQNHSLYTHFPKTASDKPFAATDNHNTKLSTETTARVELRLQCEQDFIWYSYIKVELTGYNLTTFVKWKNYI